MIQYKDIFLALYKENIRYLVAGGIAVNLHRVNRSTIDLDIILHLEKQNAIKFVTVMEKLGYKSRAPVDPIKFADPDTRQLWIEEKNMRVFSFISPLNPFEQVDVFIEEPKPFDMLFANRLEVRAFGIIIHVVGINDLIEMKKVAGRDTDLFDVQQLTKLGMNKNEDS